MFAFAVVAVFVHFYGLSFVVAFFGFGDWFFFFGLYFGEDLLDVWAGFAAFGVGSDVFRAFFDLALFDVAGAVVGARGVDVYFRDFGLAVGVFFGSGDFSVLFYFSVGLDGFGFLAGLFYLLEGAFGVGFVLALGVLVLVGGFAGLDGVVSAGDDVDRVRVAVLDDAGYGLFVLFGFLAFFGEDFADGGVVNGCVAVGVGAWVSGVAVFDFVEDVGAVGPDGFDVVRFDLVVSFSRFVGCGFGGGEARASAGGYFVDSSFADAVDGLAVAL